MSNSVEFEVLIPRGLCLFEDNVNINIDVEDFCSASITWKNGFVSELKPLKIKNKKPKKILFPRFVEVHSHFDKSFISDVFPNLKSNYEGALAANLLEHKTRTTKKVLERVEKSLNLAIKNGYRAIRSHIDTYQNQGNEIWIKLFNLQKNYSTKLKLQFVALSPLDFGILKMEKL